MTSMPGKPPSEGRLSTLNPTKTEGQHGYEIPKHLELNRKNDFEVHSSKHKHERPKIRIIDTKVYRNSKSKLFNETSLMMDDPSVLVYNRENTMPPFKTAIRTTSATVIPMTLPSEKNHGERFNDTVLGGDDLDLSAMTTPSSLNDLLANKKKENIVPTTPIFPELHTQIFLNKHSTPPYSVFSSSSKKTLKLSTSTSISSLPSSHFTTPPLLSSLESSTTPTPPSSPSPSLSSKSTSTSSFTSPVVLLPVTQPSSLSTSPPTSPSRKTFPVPTSQPKAFLLLTLSQMQSSTSIISSVNSKGQQLKIASTMRSSKNIPQKQTTPTLFKPITSQQPLHSISSSSSSSSLLSLLSSTAPTSKDHSLFSMLPTRSKSTLSTSPVAYKENTTTEATREIEVKIHPVITTDFIEEHSHSTVNTLNYAQNKSLNHLPVLNPDNLNNPSNIITGKKQSTDDDLSKKTTHKPSLQQMSPEISFIKHNKTRSNVIRIVPRAPKGKQILGTVVSTVKPTNKGSISRKFLFATDTERSGRGGGVRVLNDKSNVATFSQPNEEVPQNMYGTIAAVVLPLICLLTLITLAAFIIRRRRHRQRAWKKRNLSSDDISCDAMSVLVPSDDTLVNPSQLDLEGLYAVVDKSKKRRNTESISVTDDTVLLKDFDVKQNGCFTLSNGSEDSLLDIPPPICLYAEDAMFIDEDSIEQEEQNKEVKAGVNMGNSLTKLTLSKSDKILNRVKSDSKDADITLVECDLYEGTYGTPSSTRKNRKERGQDEDDDNDSNYEIPDSPETARAKSLKLKERKRSLVNSIVSDIQIPIALQKDSSESESEDDFEGVIVPICSQHGSINCSCNIPPPLPDRLPDSDSDSPIYVSPECHVHSEPGPDWRPFHEYDPVYIPRSDPLGMDKRVDNQNYVRGRQRSDSRFTDPYEEIQFGAIYATVDDDMSGSRNNPPIIPDHTPPLPPPLVPRRMRPLSGLADMASTSTHGATKSSDQKEEPRYSGLIKADVPDLCDITPHEYQALDGSTLERKKALTEKSFEKNMCSDNIKLIDETDSETYTKLPPLLKRRGEPEQTSVDSPGNNGSYCPLERQETYDTMNNTTQDFSENEKSNVNGESDDSYEAFEFYPTVHENNQDVS